jgi:hypothetical protein
MSTNRAIPAIALALFLSSSTSIRATEDFAAEKGITVLARGPVHEAFAQPIKANPEPGPVVAKRPPDPIPEIPPDQKPQGDKVQWIPGYWSWYTDKSDFIWVSGFWRVPPPGRKWVPGYWSQADGSWQWTPGLWADARQERFDYQPTPPASVDEGPSTPAPDDNSIYAPGNWVYRNARYVWRPGYWYEAQSGWIWVPAHYAWTPAGYVYVDGYWDYPPEDRGLLYAPVSFSDPLWANPGWYYRPRYALNLLGLFGSLFVQPGWSSYYFGDWYGPGYLGLGYNPWCFWGPRYWDPLFCYGRWWNRGFPGWHQSFVNLHNDRVNGRLARPPRTLVQQNNVIINNGGNVNVTNVLNNTTNIGRNITNNNTSLVHMLTPADRISRVEGRNIPLTNVSSTQRSQFQSASHQLHEQARVRGLTEAQSANRMRSNGIPGASAVTHGSPGMPGPSLRLPTDTHNATSAHNLPNLQPRSSSTQIMPPAQHHEAPFQGRSLAPPSSSGTARNLGTGPSISGAPRSLSIPPSISGPPRNLSNPSGSVKSFSAPQFNVPRQSTSRAAPPAFSGWQGNRSNAGHGSIPSSRGSSHSSGGGNRPSGGSSHSSAGHSNNHAHR